MSTIEEIFKKEVNIKKVVKAVKYASSFALYSKSKDCNLLITQYFILNLTEEQFWELQCALLVKEIGYWFTICKGDLVQGNEVQSEEVMVYFDTIRNENVNIIPFTQLYLNNSMLYAVEAGYVGVKRDHIEMLGGLSAVKKAVGVNMIIASDFHVLTINKEAYSEYLAPLLF